MKFSESGQFEFIQSMVFRALPPLLSDGEKQGGKRENRRILARKEQNKGEAREIPLISVASTVDVCAVHKLGLGQCFLQVFLIFFEFNLEKSIGWKLAIIKKINKFSVDIETEVSPLLPPNEYFGYDYFKRNISFFDNIPTPPDFKLGPGDEIILSLWGEINSRENFIINNLYHIFINLSWSYYHPFIFNSK